MIQPLWRTVWRVLKKLKIELPYDLAISLLGIYPEKTILQKDTCIPVFTAAPLTIARTWKQPKCPKKKYSKDETVTLEDTVLTGNCRATDRRNRTGTLAGSTVSHECELTILKLL